MLGLLRRLAVAAFLTREEFGLWGILLATLITLVWLKQVGIGDKYIQQDEPDQELAFQKAFTLELALSIGYFVARAASCSRCSRSRTATRRSSCRASCWRRR